MKTLIALRHDARRLFPHSRANQRAWLKSVRNLRQGSGWVLEGGAPPRNRYVLSRPPMRHAAR